MTEGYVEVKEGKAWKQICSKHWTVKNSHVVCGMFGFPAEKTYNPKAYKYEGQGQRGGASYSCGVSTILVRGHFIAC